MTNFTKNNTFQVHLCSLKWQKCIHFIVTWPIVQIYIYIYIYMYVCMYVYTHTHIRTGEGNGNTLQYSCLANTMDGGTWWDEVHDVSGSWTRLSNFIFTFHFHALEKKMATHYSVLAWNPRDGAAWWVAVYGVAQSWT